MSLHLYTARASDTFRACDNAKATECRAYVDEQGTPYVTCPACRHYAKQHGVKTRRNQSIFGRKIRKKRP